MGGREREFLFPFIFWDCYSCFWVSNFSFWAFSFLLLASLITPPGSKGGGQRFHFRRKLFNSHRPGRRLRTNFMSRYICFSQNGVICGNLGTFWSDFRMQTHSVLLKGFFSDFDMVSIFASKWLQKF